MSAHPTRSIFHIRSWYGGFSSRSSSGSRRRPRPSCGMNRHRWGIREEPGRCRVCRIADQAAGSRRASLDFDAGRRARFDCFDRPIRFRGAGRRAAPPSFTDEDAAGTARTAKSPRSMNPITRRITRPPCLLACGPSRSFDPLRSPHPASRSCLLNGGGDRQDVSHTGRLRVSIRDGIGSDRPLKRTHVSGRRRSGRENGPPRRAPR